MRTGPALVIASLLLALTGCNCGGDDPTPDKPDAAVSTCQPACGEGQACDEASHTCKPALHEGQLCRADGGVDGACGPGLSCDFVGNAERCSVSCTSSTSAKVCGAVRKCFARPGSTSSSGYCGNVATEGQRCDDAELLKCSGDGLSCITPFGTSSGQCFKTCDPVEADPNPACGTGKSCANVFASDPKFGICVVPAGRYPSVCDHSKLVFCARNEVCVRTSETSSEGYCHARCAKPEDCASAEACATPSSSLSICVTPVARCASSDVAGCATCDPSKDQYCGPDDFCVTVSDRAVCKQDCTGGKSCATGTCRAVLGTDRSVCL